MPTQKDSQAATPQLVVKNIHQRMLAVMKEVAYIQKDLDRSVNGQYNFVSHDQVTAKVRPHLIASGIIVIPRVIRHTQDGNRMIMEIETDFINADQPDDKITVPMVSYSNGNDDKLPGKALSYAVKMTMLKVFQIETGEKEESEVYHVPHVPGLISDEALENLAGKAVEIGVNVPMFCQFLTKQLKYQINDLSELKSADVEKAEKAMEVKRKAANKAKAEQEAANV